LRKTSKSKQGRLRERRHLLLLVTQDMNLFRPLH
jgi:hypothetical protein